MKRYLKFLPLLVLLAFAIIASGCGGVSTSTPTPEKQSETAAKDNAKTLYEIKHDVEFHNYNDKLRVADNPATILWCTFFPPGVQGATNSSAAGQAFTVPITGKLTSSNKRPYSSKAYQDRGEYTFTEKEVPGADHMFGSSSEYRYGFDPTRAIYYDFTDLPSFCTTEPTVWQASETRVVIQTDKTLASLTRAAEAAIKKGDPKGALAILKGAESK